MDDWDSFYGSDDAVPDPRPAEDAQDGSRDEGTDALDGTRPISVDAESSRGDAASSVGDEDSDIEADITIDEEFIQKLDFAQVKTCACCKHSSNEINPILKGRYARECRIVSILR